MKKIILVLLALAVLFSAAAFADEPETDGEKADISARTAEFFEAWSRNDPDAMLALCNSAWKAGTEDPRTELLNILGNRTPRDVEIGEIKEIAGEGPDGLTYYLVTVSAHLDGNDGTSPEACSFRFLVRKEEDGLWYIGPTGPEFSETAEDESPAETAAAPEGDAGTDEADQPAIITFRDAVEAAGEYASIGGDIDYLSVAASKDGCDYRTVTILDDRAKELYMAALAADDPGPAFEAFDEYAWSLPVCYTEKITVKPKEQAELDTLAGKTVSEILEEGYSFYGSGGGENLPTVVDLSFGLYTYEFEVDASFEEYLDHESRNDLGSLRVKSGRLASSMCIDPNLDYLADGTYQPQVVPNYTAEELAAADNVPPAEEYTMKAWPLTAESYSDLQNNLDARYGQVYMIEGVVHQILSQDPMRVIIYTGGDGKSQPVVVESPEQRRFKWEEGKTYRIYADVNSALFILPVLTARYTYTGLPADQPGGEDLPEEAAPADSSEDSRLIGLLVTREDPAGHTDETGVIPASVTQEGPDADPEFTFGDISGLYFICFIAPEGRVVSSVDDGIYAVNFDLNEDSSTVKMDATISFVPGRDEELFFCNPVFRTGSGKVFAVPGDFMAVSAGMNPPGSSVGLAVQDVRKHTENGSETDDTTTAGVQIETVREPAEIRLAQFSEAHELLKNEAFEPGTVPEQIFPLEEADYLLLETVEKGPGGEPFTRREVIGRDVDFLNTTSCRDDRICLSHYHEVLWKTAGPEDQPVKDTVEGNMKTYREMADGTWTCDGYTYQYRLEIKGRMPDAAADSTFVYLSNTEEISFEKAYMAAGLSSNQDDYFSPGEAVLVEMN